MTRLRALGITGAIVILGGCVMQKQSAPALMGPSGFGRALTMTATPDTLPRDGASRSSIRINYRDGATNEPLVQRRILVSTTAGTLSTTEVVTDSGGNASFTYVAPSVHTPVAAATVMATPVADDAANAVAQTVLVALVGPSVPVASFTATPAVPLVGQSVTFDASGTTIDGVSCGSLCSFSWDFGDGNSGSGELVQHTYQIPGVMVVTLSVTGPGGAVGTAVRSFSLAAPAAPTASFTVTPASPTAGSQATFNASASTVGTGATLVSYSWDFGDGSNITATVPISLKTYGAPGTYIVTLTVTDNIGRSASRTSTVTVVP